MYLIDELLLHKDFKELSEEEKKIVLKELTGIQYDSYRKLILKSKNHLERENKDLEPKAYILNRVKNHITGKKASVGMKLLKYPVPAYQFFSIAAILFLILWFGFNKNEDESIPVKHVYHTDTVYKVNPNSTINEAEIETQKVDLFEGVAQEKSLVQNPKHEKSNSKTQNKEVHDLFRFGLQVDIDDFLKNQNYGERFSDNQDLKQFIVAMN